MDEDGTLVTDETLSPLDSKTRAVPEQVARHSAPTVAEPAEEPLMSHAIALEPPAVSGWKRPVPGDPPTEVENSVSNLDVSGVRINYLPSACEHKQSLTDHGSTAQGAPLQEGRTDSIPTDPRRIPPAIQAELTSPEVLTVPLFRQHPPQSQTPPVERHQPIRADKGATCQADMAELLDHVSQEISKLYPLIVDLHTASLGNILTLAPVISDLMRHPVPPQVARRILRPQDDWFNLPGLDTITSVELVSAIESSMAACDTAQMYADVILRHTTRLRTANTIVEHMSDLILDFHIFVEGDLTKIGLLLADFMNTLAAHGEDLFRAEGVKASIRAELRLDLKLNKDAWKALSGQEEEDWVSHLVISGSQQRRLSNPRIISWNAGPHGYRNSRK